MSHMLKFGVGTVQNARWKTMVERWRTIEALGFDSVWVADQFCICAKPTEPWFDGWTLLSGLATQTTRIKIGTGVTAIPWHNPAFLARKALTLDHVSNGRLYLGIGSGVPGDCAHRMTGIADWSSRERVERFGEFIEIVDRLLRNEVTTYHGNYYNVEKVSMNPPTIQKPRPPIMIAAMGRRMLKHVAQYADTWNTLGGFNGNLEERLDNVRRQNSLIDKYCAEINRDPQEIHRSAVIYDPEMYKRNWEIPAYDSVNVFKDIVERYLELGITEFILYYPIVDRQMPIFKQIAKEIIPEFRNQY